MGLRLADCRPETHARLRRRRRNLSLRQQLFGRGPAMLRITKRLAVGLAAVSRIIRDRDDLSQSEVARRGGVSERLVSDVENERANPK